MSERNVLPGGKSDIAADNITAPRRWLRRGWFLSGLIATTIGMTVDAVAQSSEIAAALQPLIKSRSIGVCIADTETRKTVFSARGDEPLKPASILKLATTAAALNTLGPEYTFTTRLLASPEGGREVHSLTVVGSGDPTFTTESMWILARAVVRLGISSIKELRIDGGAFKNSQDRSGQRAFASASSAVSFNFNSAGVSICPQKGRAATVTVDPWEASMGVQGQVRTVSGSGVSLSVDEVPAERPGQEMLFRVNGSIGEDRGCVVSYRSVSEPERYFGMTLKKFLEYLGVSVGSWRKGGAPDGAREIFLLRSKPLRDILREMNLFSSNFLAEQVLMHLGANPSGSTFDRERGLAALTSYVQPFSGGDRFEIVDGSGLSHSNRLSANTLCRLLVDQHHNERTGVEFESSLAVGQRSGTLKERDFGDGVTVRGKTGTLDGVSSLAGYLAGLGGRKYAFVIIENQSRSKNDSMVLEGKIIRALVKAVP